MRIHTRTVFQMTEDPERYELLEDESFEYDGPVAECIGGGGSSGSSSTSQQSVPWSGVQGYLTNLYRNASTQGTTSAQRAPSFLGSNMYERMGQQKLLQQSQMGGLQPYGQQQLSRTLQGQYLYPSQNAQRLTGSQLENTLSGGYQDLGLGARTNRALGSTISGQGLDPRISGVTADQLSGLAGGAGFNRNLDRQTVDELSGTLGGRYSNRPLSNQMQSQLSATLGGDYLHGGSGFDAAMEAAAAEIMPQVGAQFAGKGTYSGDLRKSAQSKELSRAFAGLYDKERNRQMQSMGLASDIGQAERSRQMEALGITSGRGEADRQRQMQALGLTTGMTESDRNRQMEAMGLSAGMTQAERQRQIDALGISTGAFSDERQRQIQGLGLTPSIDAMRYQPGQIMSDVGAQQRAAAARVQEYPWEIMSRQNALFGGFMSPSTTTQQQGGGTSPVGGALSGAAAGSYFGPWGALGGAVLGGLLS